MSNFIRDHLERNFVSCMAGQYQERHDYISQNPNPTARKADLALLTLSKRYSPFAAKLLGLSLPKGFEYAGAGSAHTVVHKNGIVLKIHRASEYVSELEKVHLAEVQTEQHSKLLQYIGDIALHQITEVDTHPLKTNKNVVVSRQPKVIFEDLGLFSAYTSDVNLFALEAAKTYHPGIEHALYDLVHSSRKLYLKTGMLLDTSGQNNIVVAEGELRCLDGLPISNPNLGDISRVMGQVDSLERHL